jgi:hypothetical protein
MKVVNCQSVGKRVEEAERGWKPEVAVQEHLRGCNRCREFYEERMKLRQLVGSLGTIAAPPDFDFKLRARLANAQPAKSLRLSFAGFAFGSRSLVVAALLLAVGAVFIFRATRVSPEAPLAQSGQTQPVVAPAKPTVVTTAPPLEAQVATTDLNESRLSPRKLNTSSSRKQTVARNAGIVSKDFSSLPAQVVKREETVADAASVFPIDASYESMKVSLDDSSGVSRTISLPKVSFGSQGFLAGEGGIVKTSTKGVW